MPGRLYLKIFLSFIAVLVMAMVMVAMLFRFTEGEKFVSRFKRFAHAQVVMVRMVVEDHVIAHSGSTAAMDDLATKLGKAYRAKIWITDTSGEIIASSFAEDPPSPLDLSPHDEGRERHHRDKVRKWEKMGGFKFTRCGDDPHCIYVTIPYGGQNGVEPGIIHYFYRDPAVAKHEEMFLIGLAVICGSVALLIMPVSWFITRRLDKLRESALRIADGDFSQRVDICGKDEVAKVAKAFNVMAESVARMVRGSKELTANVSHELRTPLTRIRIAEEMLREQFGEAGAAHLDSIREDVDDLDRLIGKLLDLSKLDLKEAPFVMETVDVSEMVDAIVTRLSPIADHRGLDVDVQLPSVAPIDANGEALHTALGNIFENGVKHADENSWLRFKVLLEADALCVIMENRHAPLVDEELTAIFEPFRRAKGTTPDGTGLGLAIAHKIIERHGGSVRAENCDDGVRFVIELPR